MTNPKPKLIEVALPLAAINGEAARDKGIRNHPQSIHRWWARRPLATARAVIWASLVDDPSGDPSMTAAEQQEERARLFGILERLIQWDNANDPVVLAEAKAEIDRSFPDGPPSIVDPFGGGGAIPLEAQRLGLTSRSGDLNPVAVLIQKAMVEIPQRFRGRPPVHRSSEPILTTWDRAQGLAADIEMYGRWLRDEAERRVGHLYPPLRTPEGKGVTPIAWIWARTVASPDPTWKGHVPLVSSWYLVNRADKASVWIEPTVDVRSQTIEYKVRHGGSPTAGRTVDRGGGRCLATGASMPYSYMRPEFRAGRVGQHLLAIVAEESGTRVFLDPSNAQQDAAVLDPPEKTISGHIFDWPGRTNVVRYGMESWTDLYTPRQLTSLTVLSDLLAEVHELVSRDAVLAGLQDDGIPLREGGRGATAYADALKTYLAFAIDKATDFNCTISSWDSTNVKIRNVFARQAIPMTWDFVECNLLGERVGSFMSQIDGLKSALEAMPSGAEGSVHQRDARAFVNEITDAVCVSTDPPYYDNICYADLSDFFFVWLRRGLSDVWPDETATLATPKSLELIANRYRAGSKEAAKKHFESGMAEFMADVARVQSPDCPATIYYAYKATETKDGEIRSTGWDTFLQAVLDAGLQVNATWPMRTEKPGRMIGNGANALASSIVLVCRARDIAAPLASRAEFVATLRSELPEAVRVLQSGNIAPVDIAQSTIGPGIKVFSRYARVVEADGSSMSVSAALGIINEVLGEVLDGEEAELDADTRFAVSWYSQHGYDAGKSGEADGLARAKNTSLSGIQSAGIGEARGGDFHLFERADLDPDWSPAGDQRLTVWEATQHLVAALERSESESAQLLHRLGGFGDRARQLAYLLFQKATEQGWADEAGSYNGLITAWPTLAGAAVRGDGEDGQGRML